MSPTKIESNHLRKTKSIGKHKLKINLGSLAGRWEAIKKWLVGTVVLLAVFLFGIIIGKYHFSQTPPPVGQPSSDLTIKSDLKQNGQENRQLGENTQVKPLKNLNQTTSPPPQVTQTETAVVTEAKGKVEKLPPGQTLESTSKPSPIASVEAPPVDKPTPASGHQSVTTSKSVALPTKPDVFVPKPATNTSKSDTLIKDSAPLISAKELREWLPKCENLVKKNRLVPETEKTNKKTEQNNQEGNDETALECYQHVLKLVPNNGQAKAGLKKLENHYQTLIDSALKKGQLEDGRRYLAELQKVNPKSPVLPVIERRLKELAAASSEKSEVLTLLKQCGEYFKAGRLLSSGKGGAAFECYNQVLAKAPNQQEAKAGLGKVETRYQQLAETFLKQKQLAKARSAIQNLQQVNPNSSKLTELQQRLNTLEQPVISARPPSASPAPPVRPPVSPPPPTVSVPVVDPSSERLPARVHRPARNQEPSPSSDTVQESSRPQTSQRQPSRCSEIFIQESLGIQPLTTEAREFKKKFCN